MVKPIVGLVISRIQRNVSLVRTRSLGIPPQRIVSAAEVKPGVRPLWIQFHNSLVSHAGFLPSVQYRQRVSPRRVGCGVCWLGLRRKAKRTLRLVPVLGTQVDASAADQFCRRDRAGLAAEGWPCEQHQEEQTEPTGEVSLHGDVKYNRSSQILQGIRGDPIQPSRPQSSRKTAGGSWSGLPFRSEEHTS